MLVFMGKKLGYFVFLVCFRGNDVSYSWVYKCYQDLCFLKGLYSQVLWLT